MTRREPEWDDKQRLWMLALAFYEAGLCQRCGHHLEDSTDPNSVWVADDPTECFSCSTLARADRAWTKRTEKDPNPIPAQAMIHTVRRVPKPSRTPGNRKRGRGTG